MRLIDADCLLQPDEKSDRVLIHGRHGGKTIAMATKMLEQKIQDAPTIDPVHAAGACYCRECKYWGMFLNGEEGRCRKVGGLIWRNDDDFCSRGERRVE